jgi:hypothetical protein
MKSALHSLIPFLPFFSVASECHLSQFPAATANSGTRLNSIPLLPISYPGRLASRNSTNSNDLLCLLYNPSARTTQKTQPLCFWEGVFTAPFHSNRSYSIVTCVFVAAGMFVPSSCLAMDVSSDITALAYGRHITISIMGMWRVVYDIKEKVNDWLFPRVVRGGWCSTLTSPHRSGTCRNLKERGRKCGKLMLR